MVLDTKTLSWRGLSRLMAVPKLAAALRRRDLAHRMPCLHWRHELERKKDRMVPATAGRMPSRLEISPAVSFGRVWLDMVSVFLFSFPVLSCPVLSCSCSCSCRNSRRR